MIPPCALSPSTYKLFIAKIRTRRWKRISLAEESARSRFFTDHFHEFALCFGKKWNPSGTFPSSISLERKRNCEYRDRAAKSNYNPVRTGSLKTIALR